MTKIRLQVALAKAGVASRRAAALIIQSGRVTVNGELVSEKGFRVEITKDKIAVDESPVIFRERKLYYMLNKPVGILSTVKDERGRQKVTDFVGNERARLYPIGRLDKDSSGLIILTNDGDLTYRLTHPRFGIERVYEVKVSGALEKKDLARLRSGVVIEGKLAKAEKVLWRKGTRRFTVVLISLREGRKREVRKMFGALEKGVITLKRVSYGTLRLGSLRQGIARPLTSSEITMLKRSVGLK
ncbi:MAG: rRNA pseudouridine synthase [Omnitrophica bacterium]|nr:rRNA pseudouridine synthase [Candidatus Omnitrophota bacterium]